MQLQKLSDRDMLRFVWAESDKPTPDFYRFKMLPFGVVSSPFQAIWCVSGKFKKWVADIPRLKELQFLRRRIQDWHRRRGLLGHQTGQRCGALQNHLFQEFFDAKES